MHILNQCKKRLDLLFMAAEHRSKVDASLMRLAVEDVRSDLEEGSELRGYVDLTQETVRALRSAPSTTDARHAEDWAIPDNHQARIRR